MQHETNSESLAALFEQWLDGKKLSNTELQSLKASSHWSEQMQIVNFMQESKAEMEKAGVPDWDINSTFVNHNPRGNSGFWQHNGLSLVAMTFSIAACGLLFFNMQHETNLATQQQQQLTAQLNEWSQKNQQILASTIEKLQTQQTESSIKLANYLMENSRVERQEDLQRVVELIQSQREDDLRFVHAELSELQYQMQVTSLNRRSQFNQSGLNPPIQVTEEE